MRGGWWVVGVLVVGALGGCDDGATTPRATMGAPFGRPLPPAPPWAAPAAPVSTSGAGTPTSSTPVTSPAASPAATGPSPTASTRVPPGPCPPLYGPGTPVPLQVDASTGAVVLTWWHNGDPGAIAYWVGVQPEGWRNPPPAPTPTPSGSASASPGMSPRPTPVTLTRLGITWTRVEAPQGCRTVTTTVPGIARGATYTLWLNLEQRTPETVIGTTQAVLTRVQGVRLP